MRTRNSFVYILSNIHNTVIYSGVTGRDLVQRVWEHRNHVVKGFTDKYNVTKLVYYEVFENLEHALVREKQIKSGSRRKKIELIEKFNPTWRDLYEDIV